VASGGGSEAPVEMRYEDENIWLTQKMMAALYDVSVAAINQHLKRVFVDNELDESAVIKEYLITAAVGKITIPSITIFKSLLRSGSRLRMSGWYPDGIDGELWEYLKPKVDFFKQLKREAQNEVEEMNDE